MRLFSGGIIMIFLFLGIKGYSIDETVYIPQQLSLQDTSLEPSKLFSLRDPFLTQRERFEFQRKELKHLRLSAVFISDKSSYAIVNGKIIKENDIIEDKKVIRIEREKIILKDSQGREYVIRLKNIVN